MIKTGTNNTFAEMRVLKLGMPQLSNMYLQYHIFSPAIYSGIRGSITHQTPGAGKPSTISAKPAERLHAIIKSYRNEKQAIQYRDPPRNRGVKGLSIGSP